MTDAQLSPAQLRILRHMLGINEPYDRTPTPYRDYYCANPGDPELLELQRLDMVVLYDTRGNCEYFRCTDAGRAAAIESHRTIRAPKAARVYSRFLAIKDAYTDLTFHEFLTNPDFAETRRDA